jgi:hypothetical protein
MFCLDRYLFCSGFGLDSFTEFINYHICNWWLFWRSSMEIGRESGGQDLRCLTPLSTIFQLYHGGMKIRQVLIELPCPSWLIIYHHKVCMCNISFNFKGNSLKLKTWLLITIWRTSNWNGIDLIGPFFKELLLFD